MIDPALPLEHPSSTGRWVVVVLASYAGIAAVGAIDCMVGVDVSFSFFYALLVGAAVWFGNRTCGVLGALLAVGAWSFADHYSGSSHVSFAVPLWNACVRFGFMMLIVGGAYFARKQLLQSEARTAVLEQTLPICAGCRRIRDEDGAWMDVESYLAERCECLPERKVCPDCAKQLYIERAAPRRTGVVQA